MLGGYRFKELFGEPDLVDPEHLKQVACDALKSYLNIHEKPVHHLISIHQVCCVTNSAFAQFYIYCKLIFIIELHSSVHAQSSAKSGNY